MHPSRTFKSSYELTLCLCRLIGASNTIGNVIDASNKGSRRELFLDPEANKERKNQASSMVKWSCSLRSQSSKEVSSSGKTSSPLPFVRNLFATSKHAMAKFIVALPALFIFVQVTKDLSSLYRPGLLWEANKPRSPIRVLPTSNPLNSVRVSPQFDKAGQP